MTDDGLNELEAACRVEANQDGRVLLSATDVLDAIQELRELRNHAAQLHAHEGTIAHLHRMLTHLGSYKEDASADARTGDGRISIQDPGR